MKCEKCGKEANYYYRSNINGKITTVNLCSECAGKMSSESGIPDIFNSMFDSMWSNMPFNMMSPMFSSPLGGFGFGLPTMLMPMIRVVLPSGENAKNEPAEAKPAEKTEQQIDPEMSKRRELNLLKEQMKRAVKNEEFELAAELRDKIRALNG